jgi:hypothetical protein
MMLYSEQKVEFTLLRATGCTLTHISPDPWMLPRCTPGLHAAPGCRTPTRLSDACRSHSLTGHVIRYISRTITRQLSVLEEPRGGGSVLGKATHQVPLSDSSLSSLYTHQCKSWLMDFPPLLTAESSLVGSGTYAHTLVHQVKQFFVSCHQPQTSTVHDDVHRH